MTPSINLTDEQIAALLEQATAPPVDPADPKQPASLKYRLGNQTFEAKTPEELQAQLDAAMSHIGQTVQNLQHQAAAAPQPAAQTPSTPQFDKEKYAKLFLENPLDAAEYLDEIRFGVAKPAQVLKTVIQDVGAIEQSNAVQQFISNTADYEATPENFHALASYMQQYGLPWNYNGMKLAFGQAKLDGKIRTSDQDAQPQQQQGGYMPSRRGAPVVPRSAQVSSTTVDQDLMDRFESMSPDKMKAFLEGIQNGR